MTRKAGVAVLVGVLLAAVTAGCSGEVGAEQGAGSDWRQLPDAPLGPRDDALLVGLGDRVLVVGGWTFSCPPNADCDYPQEPLFDDGALYDRSTDAWTEIASPPFGLRRAATATAVLDGTAYLVTSCAEGPPCEGQARLLSYRPDEDRWTDHGAVPGPQPYGRGLTTAGRSLVVYSSGDVSGEIPDLVFDPESSTWTELPDDPLPLTYDRFLVPVDDQLVLVGDPSAVLPPGTGPADLAGRFDRELAARFDLARREWVLLPDAPGLGHPVLASDRGPLLDGNFSGASGWVLDPGTWTWAALPEHAGRSEDLSGVLDGERAAYDVHTVGTPGLQVYDSVADAFVPLPAPPDRADVYGDSSAALGRDLVAVGGQRSLGSDSRAETGPVAAWLWTAPRG